MKFSQIFSNTQNFKIGQAKLKGKFSRSYTNLITRQEHFFKQILYKNTNNQFFKHKIHHKLKIW